MSDRLRAWTEDELGVTGRVLDVVRAPAPVLATPGGAVDPTSPERIRAFLEKPKDPVGLPDAPHEVLASMGNYIFNADALEDAVILARCATDSDLAAYDAERRPRATMISKRSARIGQLAQLQSTPAVAVRNLVMKATPSSSMLRSLAPVLGWRPPTTTPRSS